MENVNVIASLKAAGLFNLEKTTKETVDAAKSLSTEDKNWLIDRIKIECPQHLVVKS